MRVPRYLLLALLRKFGSSGSYHSCAAGGDDELPVTECMGFQRPPHEACPLLPRRKVRSVTRRQSYADLRRTLGYLFSSAAPVHACALAYPFLIPVRAPKHT